MVNLSWCGTCGWFRSPSSVHSFCLGGHGELYTGPWKVKFYWYYRLRPSLFLSKTGFKTPLIVAANKSYWRLDESAKMWGGHLARTGEKCVCGEKMRMWTCPDDLYALLGARRGRGGALVALTNYSITLISSKLPLNVVFSYWLRFYFDARRFLKENRGSVLDFLSKIF